MGKQKIRFINTSYETLFFVDDGGSIEIEIGNEWKRYPCRYIDEYHFKLENCVYHIYEFAILRERVAYRYRPAETQTETEAKGFVEKIIQSGILNPAIKTTIGGNYENY
jgi:hypothetical protein